MNDYNELIESLRNMEPMVCGTAADAIEALQSRVAELESRLEISPLHNVDGIMARDATIKLQDERIAELEAERDVWRNKYMDKIGQMDVLQEFASKLEAERAERERQEPIATVGWDRNFMGVVWHGKDMPEKGVETLLYAAPPVTAPVRLTDDQVERALRTNGAYESDAAYAMAKDGLLTDARAVETAVLRANGFKVDE